MKPENKAPKPLFKIEDTLAIDIPKIQKPSQLIIIGGGWSKKEGIEKGLWDKLKNKFTLGTNYNYHFFNSTALVYVDVDFYNNNYKDLNKLPLVIGKYHSNIKKEVRKNTVMLKAGHKYTRNLEEGVYKSSLSGIWALSLGIYLLNHGEIFLLGMDYGDNGKKDKNGKFITHSYQGLINHSGIGKINYYRSKNRADKDYEVYSKETKCEIYNVSIDSRINTFPKISYDIFFSMLDNNTYDQFLLRKHIRQQLDNKNINK